MNFFIPVIISAMVLLLTEVINGVLVGNTNSANDIVKIRLYKYEQKNGPRIPGPKLLSLKSGLFNSSYNGDRSSILDPKLVSSLSLVGS